MTRVCVFGDSIAWGMRDTERGGWVDRFKAYLLKFCNAQKGIFHEVFNLGNPGDSSSDLLGSMENECHARLGTEPQYKHINVIIIAIGMNDAALLRNKNPKTSAEQFKRNIEKLIEISREFVDKIVFVGITPVDETKISPLPWNANIYYKNEYAKEYDEIIKSVCKENNIFFVGLFDKFSRMNYKTLLEDGVHPNSKGHQKIFEVVKGFLIENKIV